MNSTNSTRTADNKQYRYYLIYTVIILLASVAGFFAFQKMHAFDPNKMHMTVLNDERDLSPFELKQSDGRAYQNENLKGKWSVIFFGFTRCAMLCPTTMAKLNKIDQLLSHKNTSIHPQFMMITIDPEHDSAARVDEYAKGFNRSFIGLGGTSGHIQAITKELGIAYFKTPLSDHQDKGISHTGALTVIDPSGKVFGFYASDIEVDLIANDFAYMSKRLNS